MEVFRVFDAVRRLQQIIDAPMGNEKERILSILPFRLCSYDAGLGDRASMGIRIFSVRKGELTFGVLHTPTSRVFIFESFNDPADTLKLRRIVQRKVSGISRGYVIKEFK